MKPFIYQERRKFALVRKDQPGDDNVFMRKEYIYGSDGRANAGYGLWQLAFASKADLTADNYEAARIAMATMLGDADRPLGLKPNVLVVPPALEGAAMRLFNNGSRIVVVGETPVAVQNEWAGTAKPIIASWAA